MWQRLLLNSFKLFTDNVMWYINFYSFLALIGLFSLICKDFYITHKVTKEAEL